MLKKQTEHLKAFIKFIPVVGPILKRRYQNLKIILESWVGPEYAREQYKSHIYSNPTLQSGLKIIKSRFEKKFSKSENSTDNPIFIFSAGWRSGSTLLQRLVMSGESVFIWGEPYGHAHLIQDLARPLAAFTNEWPNNDFFIENNNIEKLRESWVANLYPSVGTLKKAHIGFFDTLFKDPAKKNGFKRWGLKDVRLEISHAEYLRWLFPEAKFIFLIRDPKEAYRSYRAFRNWYAKWPHEMIMTPRQFALHWRRLTEGYLNGYQDVDGLFLKYEDIISDNFDMLKLSMYLGCQVDRNVLSIRIKSKKNSISKKSLAKVPSRELRIIEKIVGNVAVRAGYQNY